MLEELIKNFYDEEDCLKDEVNVTFTREAMIKIVNEFAELKMNQVEKEDEL